MRTASILALVLTCAMADGVFAEDDDYLASKVYELGLAGESYLPNDTVLKGGDCAGGLVYDDGSFESYGSSGGSNAGFVQLFSPQQLPFQFDTVCVCFDRDIEASTQILGNIVFYDDDGPDGSPGTLLGSVQRTISGISADTPCSFIEVNLNDDAPLITGGNVYVGVLFNTTNYPGINLGADTSDLTSSRNIHTTSGGINFNSVAGGIFDEYKAIALRGSGHNICSEIVPGALTSMSAHWDRVIGGAVNLNCESVPSDSGNNNMAYEVTPISSSFGGLFTAEITTTTPAVDTVMMLYCHPFDATNPTANLIAYDDDDGPSTLSAFTAANGLELSPGTTYDLVISSFLPQTYGGYELCLGNGYMREPQCMTSVTDNLSASSPHYNRVISNTISTLCTANTADTVQDNMPYAAIPFELNTGGYLEVSLNDAGTNIVDPVMTLYCDPFNPDAPGTNVIAYDDNDGGGLMPAFNLSDALLLDTNTRYWLVVSTWQGNDGDNGNFDVCFGNDVTAGYPVVTCGDAAIFGHDPTSLLDSWNGQNIGDAASIRYLEHFNGLVDPIRSLTWYGFIASPGTVLPCSPGPATYEVTFYSDDGGSPGTSVYSEILEGAIVPTGIQYQEEPQFQLVRFAANLTNEVFLTDGWFRIVAQDAASCTVYWLYSMDGDSIAGRTVGDAGAFLPAAQDFAFCLSEESVVTLHAADANLDFMINLSELLRVIQFFNSNGYHCDALGEDGYAPGPGNESCAEHSSDYNPANWEISLSELLRIIQFFNSGGYHVCPEGEDGFCPGL